MEVRSPFAFALSLLCLATSAGLGILVHDAAVGYDAVQSAAPGDEVRFKGEVLEPESLAAILQTWSFQETVAELMITPDEHHVIVLHTGELIQNGTWVIDGIVRGHMNHGDIGFTIVDATAVTAPILFA